MATAIFRGAARERESCLRKRDAVRIRLNREICFIASLGFSSWIYLLAEYICLCIYRKKRKYAYSRKFFLCYTLFAACINDDSISAYTRYPSSRERNFSHLRARTSTRAASSSS